MEKEKCECNSGCGLFVLILLIAFGNYVLASNIKDVSKRVKDLETQVAKAK